MIVDFGKTQTVTVPLQVAINLRQQRPATGFQPNYFVVIVDGMIVPGFANATFSTATVTNVTGGTSITLATSLDPTTSHSIRVFKSSEAEWAWDVPEPNYVTLCSVTLVGLGSPSLLPPAPLPSRKLEFIGDSITAGYCNILWVPDIDRHHTNRSNLESFWLSWPTRLCEAANAVCHTAAWSGFALMKSKYCGKPVTMPEVFRRTLASVNSSDWEYAAWIPDGVVINLGTNDFHGWPETDVAFPQLFAETYLKWVLHLTSPAVYGPNVHIFLGVGPMTLAYSDPVREVVQNATSQGLKVHFLNQSGVSHGDCQHPSYQSDAILAKSSGAEIATALGWGP